MSLNTAREDRRSLGDVHRTVPVAHPHLLKRLFAFMGPAYLVSVGYMDPGNWATDLEGRAVRLWADLGPPDIKHDGCALAESGGATGDRHRA